MRIWLLCYNVWALLYTSVLVDWSVLFTFVLYVTSFFWNKHFSILVCLRIWKSFFGFSPEIFEKGKCEFIQIKLFFAQRIEDDRVLYAKTNVRDSFGISGVRSKKCFIFLLCTTYCRTFCEVASYSYFRWSQRLMFYTIPKTYSIWNRRVHKCWGVATFSYFHKLKLKIFL